MTQTVQESRSSSTSPTTDGTPNPSRIQPQAGRQVQFFETEADLCIYGGAAGGGKSWCLLAEPLRHINVPGFGCTTFRRTSKQILKQGSLWDEARKIYGPLKAVENKTGLYFTFPGPAGNRVNFGHCEHEKDLESWFGSQICLLQIDELQTFTKRIFLELIARNRSTCGVKPYIRCTCNPDPNSWILELIGWFIDPKGDPIEERCGQVIYFAVVSDTFVVAETRDEILKAHPGTLPMSFTFIKATVDDNQILMTADPAYKAKLMSLPHARRAALKDGNWKTKPEGKLFKYAWFKWCKPEDVPTLTTCYVGCDPSGGHGARNDEQGIVAAGRGEDGKFYVLGDWSCKETPAGWAKETVQAYHLTQAGAVAAESNFGGEMVESNILAQDEFVRVELVHASRGKKARAEPVATLYENGMVIHVGSLDELEAEMVGYDPEENAPSPNRMDALVWALAKQMGSVTPAVIQYYKELAEKERLEKEGREKK